MLKRLLSHTAIYGLAPYIPKLLGFVVLPIITKDLTSVDYGVAGFITAYVGAIGVFNTIGLRLVLVNSFYHYPNKFHWVWRQLYGFLCLWVFAFALITAFALFFAIPEEAKENSILIILLNIVPLVCFGPVNMIGSTYFQLSQKPMQVAGRSAIFGILTILLNLYTISVLKLGYMGWFWTECIVLFLTNISYWSVVNRTLKITPILNFKWRLIRKSLKISVPTIPHYYATYLLNSSDRFIMDVVKIPTNMVGRYTFASNFGNYFNTLGMASGLAIGPMLNSLYKEGKDILARDLIFVLQSFFLVLTFGICLWLKEIFFILVANDALRQTYPLAIVLIMAYNYRPMYLASNSKLFFNNRTAKLWQVTFVAGAISVVANFILIPIYGTFVAAITTFISYMYMGYIGFTFNDFKILNKANYYPVFWLLLTITLTALAYGLSDIQILAKCLLTFILGTITLILLVKYRFKVASRIKT